MNWRGHTTNFLHRNGQVFMDMTFTNKAMQPMSGFAIQFNKNSFGIIPAQPLQVPTPLTPNQPCDVSLPLNTTGPVQKMDPLNNLQVLQYDECRSSFHSLNLAVKHTDERDFACFCRLR